MLRSSFWYALFCAFTVTALSGCNTEKATPAPRAPLPVKTVEVHAADEAHWVEALAKAEAGAGIAVKPQVSGKILAQRYVEGDLVKAGDVLFEIDPENFLAQLASAEASRKGLEVELAQAEREFKRNERLYKANVVSQKEYDDARSLRNQTAYSLAQAQATENEARISLEWTKVRAPVAGYVSKALVNPGTVVTSQSTELADITQKDDVRAVFAISDRDLSLSDITTASKVRVFRSNGEELPATLDYVAPSYGADTGTRVMRARMPADSGVLPGEFLTVRLMTTVDKNAWRVPQRAVKQLPDGTYAVFVLNNGKAEQKLVDVGLWEGRDWVIRKGLQDGDKVIVNQLIKLQDGTAVTPESDAKTGTQAS